MSEKADFNTTAAATALIRRAVEIAKRDYEADPSESLPLGQNWTPLNRTTDSAVFRLTASSLDARQLAVGTAVGQLRESPEARVFAEALEEDATLGPYIGKMAFAGGMGLPFSHEALADALISFALRNSDWDAVSDAASDIWADFVPVSLREQEQTTIIAPLQNFVGPTEEVAVGDRLVLDQMTDEEISRAISIGVVTSPFPGAASRGDIWVTSLWAIRTTFAEERVFTAPEEPPSPEAAQGSREPVAAAVDGIVHSLLLFKPGFVSAESAALFAAEPLDPHAAGWIARMPLGTKAGRQGFPTYELSADEVEEFVGFHNALVEARAAHAPLDVAVRRFGDAAGRTRPDDQLTDLIISLEALLLTKSEQGEKRFTVALRVAAFVEMSGTKRRDILGFIKRAYDVRSSIVHGGAPEQKHLKNLAGEKVELQAFADETMEVVRGVLRQVTEQVEQTGRFAVDWEVHLLGDQ